MTKVAISINNPVNGSINLAISDARSRREIDIQAKGKNKKIKLKFFENLFIRFAGVLAWEQVSKIIAMPTTITFPKLPIRNITTQKAQNKAILD